MLKRRLFLQGSTAVMATRLAPAASVLTPRTALAAEVVLGDSAQGQELAVSFVKALRQVPRQRFVCRNAGEVARQVKTLSGSGEAFSVFSTGHCFAGHSQSATGTLDISAINHVEISGDGSSVRIGAGARLGNIQAVLAGAGLTLPGGTHASVGITGLTLGGGIGFLTRQFGLTCDHLREIEMVVADGTLLRAGPNENADLFWAARGGGGGSFGVLTELVFKALAMPRATAVAVTLIVPPQDAIRIASNWQAWSLEGRETTTHLKLFHYGGGKIAVLIQGISFKPEETVRAELEAVAGRIKGIGAGTVFSGDAAAIAAKFHGGGTKVSSLDIATGSELLAKPLAQQTTDALIDLMASSPHSAVDVTFEPMGGAAAGFGKADSAFIHRDAAFAVYFLSTFRRPGDLEKRQPVLEAARALIRPEATGCTYVNYPEVGLENWQRRYWGENLERLVEIKKRYDPGNLFRHAQSVPVSV